MSNTFDDAASWQDLSEEAAMDMSTMTTSIWAQVYTAAGAPAGTPGAPVVAPTGAVQALSLSLRRWYSSLTLSSPDTTSGLAWLWPIVLGFIALFALMLVFQGPVRVLRQLLDVPGLLKLQAAALARLRVSGRLIAVVIGTSVLTWTMSQTMVYDNPRGREDLSLLMKSRALTSIVVEHGVLAGATPLRDIIGLGNMIPMLIAAAVLVFQFSSERWGSVTRVISPRGSRDAAWGTVCWGACALYAVYRIIGLLYGSFDVPLGNCAGIEAVLVPILMLLADGLLLAWVCVEVRGANLPERPENDPLDLSGVVGLIPAASVVCLLIFPGRYLATTTQLLMPYSMTLPQYHPFSLFMTWILGWGVIHLQAAALLAIGMIGTLTWSRGTIASLFVSYKRLLKAEGGRVLGVIAFGSLVGGSLAALAYWLVLSFPTQTWVLAAADSYAHYVTLPIGLLMVAALVELGERSLPLAALAKASSETDATRDESPTA